MATEVQPSTDTAEQIFPVDLSWADEFRLEIYDTERFRKLVAVIEIVSPANKDRAEHRARFCNKMVELLCQEVCVSLVDLVTVRTANLCAEVLQSLGVTDRSLPEPPPSIIFAATFRPLKTEDQPDRLQVWR